MIEIKITGSLEKVFPDEEFHGAEFSGTVAARGERCSFQVLLRESEAACFYRVAVSSRLNARVRVVEAVPVRLPANCPDGDFLRTTPGLYPDLLDELLCHDRVRVLPRQWRALWVTVIVDEECPAGEYPIELEFSRIDWNDNWLPEVVGRAVFRVNVLPFTLPEQQLLRYEWFSPDSLVNYYRVTSWSGEHWRIVENFIRNAAMHGINVLYTPLWTPPLDTAVGGERTTCQLLEICFDPASKHYTFDFSRLRRFLALGRACGMKKFVMSHLFTQWGAKFTPKIVARVGNLPEQKIFGWHVSADDPEYAAFLRTLIPQLITVLREEEVADDCFFSLSDEPQLEQLEEYRRRVELVEPLLEGIPTIEALSNFDFYETGLVKCPVPANNHIAPFVGRVPELWTYYCCGQEQKVPNRFMAMPSRRNRIMGVLAFVYDLAGFLQWGFNFYYTQHSMRAIDPFAVTDGGMAFPAGDPFLVYPGTDGEPLDSIRHEVFFEGLQDLRALRLLEKRIGRAAVLELINAGLEQPVSMEEYPRSDAWLLGLRNRVYAKLAEG